MKYSEADIMNADKKGIDYNCGENNLYREKADFDTVAKTDSLIEAMPKKQTKTTVDPSVMKMADDTSLYS
jgi:hypothetical protein